MKVWRDGVRPVGSRGEDNTPWECWPAQGHGWVQRTTPAEDDVLTHGHDISKSEQPHPQLTVSWSARGDDSRGIPCRDIEQHEVCTSTPPLAP